IFRWKDIRLRLWPIMTLFASGFLAEYGVWISVHSKAPWQPINNLFILADSFLIPVQFAVWGLLTRKTLIVALILPILCSWFYFHVWPGSIYSISVYYRIIYSFMIVLLSIGSINYLIIHVRESLQQNPIFIFLTEFLIFYSYQLIYEAAYAFSLIDDNHSKILLNRTFALINFACNILYGIAVCCIPADPVRRWRRL